MDFAPYQDSAPDVERAKSPPPRRSLSRSPRPISPSPYAGRPGYQHQTPNIAEALPPPDSFARQGSFMNSNSNSNSNIGFGSEDVERGIGGGVSGAGIGRDHVDLFETSLPMRMDHEAMLAYILLPPAGGVLLLVMEHKSDYVRYHAWQSSLLFAAVFVVHLIFSFSAVISWILFVLDIALIGFLALKAYQDADTLDRYEVPFFGRLASSFVDDE